jgi:hypothetical protein
VSRSDGRHVGRGRCWQDADLQSGLVFFEVLGWNVVFGHLVGVDFGDIRIGRVFDTHNKGSFKGLAFFEKFFNAFRIRNSEIRQALQITGLSGGFRAALFAASANRGVGSGQLAFFLHTGVPALFLPSMGGTGAVCAPELPVSVAGSRRLTRGGFRRSAMQN